MSYRRLTHWMIPVLAAPRVMLTSPRGWPSLAIALIIYKILLSYFAKYTYAGEIITGKVLL